MGHRARYHEKLVELCVEQDDDLMMGYLEGETLPRHPLAVDIAEGWLGDV